MAMNGVDYFIIGILVLSTLFGFARGILKEIISLLTWIAAFVVASVFSARFAAMFMGTSVDHVSVLALGMSFITLFIGTLLVGILFNYFINAAAAGTGIGFFSRLLGAVFGFLRGALVVLFFVFVAGFTALSSQPGWEQSKLVAYFEPYAKRIGEIVSPAFENLKKKMVDEIDHVKEKSERE